MLENHPKFLLDGFFEYKGIERLVNKRANIYALIDEAHRTTGGDLASSINCRKS